MICVNHVSVGERLLPLSFKIEAGEVLHVVGPNGSGKSTLLSAIAGVTDEGMQGELVIDERAVLSLPIVEQAHYRAYLTQQSRPVFNVDVFQFLILSLPKGVLVESSVAQEALNVIVNSLELEDKLHRSVHTLSGGEWQRVRIAGVCLQVFPSLNPYAKLLLLDEPAAPLDIGQQNLLHSLVASLSEKGLAIVIANHDLNVSLKHADKVLLLNKGVAESFGAASDVLTAERLSQTYKARIRRVTIDEGEILVM